MNYLQIYTDSIYLLTPHSIWDILEEKAPEDGGKQRSRQVEEI